MILDSSYYTIWAVFTFLEAFGIAYIRNPELKPIRLFLVFSVLRHAILLVEAHSVQAYWDIGWTTKEIELIWLALIAGSLIQRGRAWRLPAFSIAMVCFDALWRMGWPYWTADASNLHQLQRTSCIIILGTLLIGAIFVLERKQLPLAGAVALLAGADMVSAQSYLVGYFAPKVASVVWVVGLCTLVAAAKAHPRFLELRLSGFARRESESPDISSEMCIRLPLSPRPRFWS